MRRVDAGLLGVNGSWRKPRLSSATSHTGLFASEAGMVGQNRLRSEMRSASSCTGLKTST
jgi:hypothetical protein